MKALKHTTAYVAIVMCVAIAPLFVSSASAAVDDCMIDQTNTTMSFVAPDQVTLHYVIIDSVATPDNSACTTGTYELHLYNTDTGTPVGFGIVGVTAPGSGDMVATYIQNAGSTHAWQMDMIDTRNNSTWDSWYTTQTIPALPPSGGGGLTEAQADAWGVKFVQPAYEVAGSIAAAGVLFAAYSFILKPWVRRFR